jgi:hypothetical protein
MVAVVLGSASAVESAERRTAAVGVEAESDRGQGMACGMASGW